MSIGHEAKSLFGHLLRAFHAGDEKLAANKIDALPVIHLESGGFDHGQPIPLRFSQEGENLSPELRWRNLPPGTQELVLLCEDPDAPMPQPFLHWIAFNIATAMTGLPEGVPLIASAGFGMMRQGKNDAKSIGYTGPMPPIGHGLHHYHFQLFALNTKLSLPDSLTREQLAQAMLHHVLAQGELIGTYERK